MFDRLHRSWELTKQSIAVLRQDKHLVIFPILSSIACLIVMASFAVPLLTAVDWESVSNSAGSQSSAEFKMQPWYYPVLFLFYFVNYFVIAFFNSALIACAIKRFNGEETSVSIGLAAAAKRLPQLLAWSLVNATVGMVLRMISERAGLLGRIVIGLVGMVWTIATYFVVPVLVMEGLGPIASVKRSTQILRKVWGESLVAHVGIGAVTGLIGLAVVVLIMGGSVGLAIATESYWPAIIGGGLSVIALVLLALISSTLQVIVTAACYRFAATGLIAEQFEGNTLRGMFKVKGE